MTSSTTWVEDLSFTAMRDGRILPKYVPGRQLPRCFWHVPQTTGDYGFDSRLGRQLAREYLAARRSNADVNCYLPAIVEDMPHPLGWVERAFLRFISEVATTGHARAERMFAAREAAWEDRPILEAAE